MPGMQHKEEGFTMIEMMVVLVIISVLVVVGVKFYSGYIAKAKIDKAKTDISTMQAVVEGFYAENNFYPGDTDAASLATLGLNTDLVSTYGGEVKNYMYDQWLEGRSYKIYTGKLVDGTFYVVGVGTDGISEKATVQPTT